MNAKQGLGTADGVFCGITSTKNPPKMDPSVAQPAGSATVHTAGATMGYVSGPSHSWSEPFWAATVIHRRRCQHQAYWELQNKTIVELQNKTIVVQFLYIFVQQ